MCESVWMKKDLDEIKEAVERESCRRGWKQWKSPREGIGALHMSVERDREVVISAFIAWR